MSARDRQPGWLGTLVGIAAVLLGLVPAALPRPLPEPSAPVMVTRDTLEITVTDREGHPLSQISLRVSQGTWSASGTTDPNGRAQVAIPDGELQLLAWGDGWARSELTLRGMASATIDLEPAAPLSGQVVDPAGHGLPARVLAWIGQEPTPHVADVDEDGRFELAHLPSGAGRVEAHAEGHAPRTLPIEGRLPMRIVLPPAAVIAGLVYDQRGNPAAGALVSLVGSGVWPADRIRTDDDGHFRWPDVPPGIYELKATQGPQVSPSRGGIELVAGGSTYVTLRMQAGVELFGSVQTEDGEPIVGAELSLTEQGVSLFPQTETSDNEGRFRFPASLPGEQLLSVMAEGYVPLEMSVLEGPVEVVLSRGATVSGVVIDGRDRPVAGAIVRWLGDAPVSPRGSLGVTIGPVPPIPMVATESSPSLTMSTAGEAITDEEGHFILDGLAPGVGQLYAQEGSYAPVLGQTRTIAAADVLENVTLRLPDGATIDGRVLDSRGYPVPSVLVELRTQREPWPRSMLASNDGTFSFGGLLGDAVLIARTVDGVSVRERVEILPEQFRDRFEVELRLPGELVELHGRIFDPDNYPVAGAHLRLRSLRARTPMERVATSAQDGTFTLPMLPLPPYRLEVDHPDYVLWTEEVSSVEEELRVNLRHGGAVVGQIIDEWNEAPVLAEVEISSDDIERQMITDVDGRFRFEMLPLGRYRIRIQSRGRLDIEQDVMLDRALLDTGQLKVFEAGGLAGVLVDALGAPVSGATVSLVGGELETQTDSQGRWALPGIRPGLHEVIARAASSEVQSERLRVERNTISDEVRLMLPDIEPSGDATTPAEIRTGVAVRIEARDHQAVIVEVLDGSARQLRVGDIVVAVDDEEILVPSQARALLRGPAGTQAQVRIQRGRRALNRTVPRVRHETQ